MNLKHSCLNSSSRTHRTRPLLQQTGMPRQLCPTADAQLHAAANAAATSCDHHGGIHFELGIDPEARLLLTLHKLHHVGIADLLAWYDECQQCSGNPSLNECACVLQVRVAFQKWGLPFPPWREASEMIPRWLPASADDVEVTSSDSLAVVSGTASMSAQDQEAAEDPDRYVQDL